MNADHSTTRYLDLMKKTLTFMLWKEPGMPLDAITSTRRSRPKRLAARLAAGLLRPFHLRLIRVVDWTNEQRTEGEIWPSLADTMVGLKRLNNIQFCVEDVLRNHVPGDLIETGVWRGGSCIFMKAVLVAHGITGRRIFVADSFAGLPKPDPSRYPVDREDTTYQEKFLAVSQETVMDNFRKYDLLDDQVVFLKGWFKDTLPTAPIEQLAVMRLDGDLYQSTWEALTALYPKLSVGGYCIIDDYAIGLCRKAVDDFRSRHGIAEPLERIDWTGAFWKKMRS
jgi:O-methyltransferase